MLKGFAKWALYLTIITVIYLTIITVMWGISTVLDRPDKITDMLAGAALFLACSLYVDAVWEKRSIRR